MKGAAATRIQRRAHSRAGSCPAAWAEETRFLEALLPVTGRKMGWGYHRATGTGPFGGRGTAAIQVLGSWLAITPGLLVVSSCPLPSAVNSRSCRGPKMRLITQFSSVLGSYRNPGHRTPGTPVINASPHWALKEVVLALTTAGEFPSPAATTVRAKTLYLLGSKKTSVFFLGCSGRESSCPDRARRWLTEGSGSGAGNPSPTPTNSPDLAPLSLKGLLV